MDVKLACSLLFVDMEGLNDGRAVKTIVPQVNPRKMVFLSCLLYRHLSQTLWQIIVHATPSATDALLDSCASIRLMTKDIYYPGDGEVVQIGQHVNSFSLSLSEELLSSVKWSKVSTYFYARCKPENTTTFSLKTLRLGTLSGGLQVMPVHQFPYLSPSAASGLDRPIS